MGQRDRAAGVLAEVLGIIEHDDTRRVFGGPILEVFLILAEDGGHESIDFQSQLSAVLAEYLITAAGVAHAREVGDVGSAGVLCEKHIRRRHRPNCQ